MATGARARSQQHVNYVDFLCYALALTWEVRGGSQLFTGDIAKWHAAVLAIIEQGLTRGIPELEHLNGTFDRRPGYPPYSDGVDHWMHVMAQARLLSNLDLRKYIMTGNQREAILRLNEERLSVHLPLIQQMAEIFREKLAVPS